MASKVFRSVILGAPGSGKGTISSRIIKNFNLEHVSSGDKLRLHIQNKTEVGLQVTSYIKEGKLVPDSIMLKLITSEIQKVGKSNWLLDGFPRTLSQAQELWSVQPIDLVINLQVPFDIIVERVKGRWIHLPSGRVYNIDFNAPKVPGKDDITGEDLVQRVDDKPEVVMKRLMEYDNIISPVINFYKGHGIVRDFKGNTSDEIWPNVLNSLTTYIPQKLQNKL